jgi:3-oxoacyl-[acyl-carrier protein] reductase
MNIIVTGTSRGIGYELVKILSQNQSNRIIAVSRNKEKLDQLIKECKSDSVIAIPFDLNNAESRSKFVSEIKKKMPEVDVLVNNAGTLVNKPFEKITEQEINYMYNVNVISVFQLIQSLLPYMGKKIKAHIVNISSMGGFQGSAKFPGLSAYSSSKAALAGLSECLAEELKEKNIAVNCLCLGAVQTDMLKEAFPGYKAPVTANQMAHFIADFSLNGHNYFNGKVLPVSLSTP